MPAQVCAETLAQLCREAGGPLPAVRVRLQEGRLPRERVAPFARFLVGVGGAEPGHPLDRDRHLPFALLGLIAVPDRHGGEGSEPHDDGHDGDEEQQEPPPEQHRPTVAVENLDFLARRFGDARRRAR